MPAVATVAINDLPDLAGVAVGLTHTMSAYANMSESRCGRRTPGDATRLPESAVLYTAIMVTWLGVCAMGLKPATPVASPATPVLTCGSPHAAQVWRSPVVADLAGFWHDRSRTVKARWGDQQFFRHAAETFQISWDVEPQLYPAWPEWGGIAIESAAPEASARSCCPMRARAPYPPSRYPGIGILHNERGTFGGNFSCRAAMQFKLRGCAAEVALCGVKDNTWGPFRLRPCFVDK